jgi:hypothetical protein
MREDGIYFSSLDQSLLQGLIISYGTQAFSSSALFLSLLYCFIREDSISLLREAASSGDSPLCQLRLWTSCHAALHPD